MIRLLLIVALWAFVAALFAPAFDVLMPHHDDAGFPHAAQNDDCGCLCHVVVDAVMSSERIEYHAVSHSIAFFEHHSLPDPLPASLDRPPELFS
jgi:hypothetical protein